MGTGTRRRLCRKRAVRNPPTAPRGLYQTTVVVRAPRRLLLQFRSSFGAIISIRHVFACRTAGMQEAALDEIEFVTGATNTKWGAVRAQLGHPKPFALHYVEIGNEDWFEIGRAS